MCRLKWKQCDEGNRKIIRDDGKCLKNLQTDRGKELYNSDVQKFLKKSNIIHYSTYSMKASVIERFNHTLKNDMWKEFTHIINYNWIDIMPRLVITMRTSIELSVCGPSMFPPRLLTGS